MPELYKTYKEVIAPKLVEKRNYKNKMEIPKLSKIIISTGLNSSLEKDAFAEAKKYVTAISGQAAVTTKSKKNISNFKLRKGMPVGVMVTLRNKRMYEFLDRFVNIVLPQVRDFRGINPKGFDGKGNYNMGLNDVSVFPEIELDKMKRHMGINICMVTTAKKDEEAKDLLTFFGMPFAK